MKTAAGFSLATGVLGNEPGEREMAVAVIGHTGRGGYGHGLDTMWRGVPGVRIVGVADPDGKGLEEAGKRLGGVRGYADYREMLAELKPEIVSVAPRHIDQHHAMCLAAIEAGARGIYIEKPFCRTPAEADEIVAAAKEGNVKLALAHRNRYHPVLPLIRTMVEEGRIGRLLEVRCRGKEDARGGVLDLWVLGSHVLNLAVCFTGKPVSCSAVVLKEGRPVVAADVIDGQEGTGPSAGDEVHARYETGGGVPVFFDSIAHAGRQEANFGLQLVGNQGIIDLRIDVEPLAHFMEGNPFYPAGERKWVPVGSGGIGVAEPVPDMGKRISSHRAAAEDLLESIREGREPLCNGEEGRLTVEMIHAVMESHVRGGARISLPSPLRENPFGNSGDW